MHAQFLNSSKFIFHIKITQVPHFTFHFSDEQLYGGSFLPKCKLADPQNEINLEQKQTPK